jgi:tyrosine-specific transport protein
MFFGLIFGIYSALVAYLIAEGQSLSYMFFGSFDYSIYFSLCFWGIMVLFTYFGFTPLKRYTKFVLIIIFILLIIAFFSISSNFSPENLFSSNFSFGDLFLPFGVILFSFIGFSSIPEARWVLYKREHLFKKAIIFGMLIPLLFYSLFSFIMLGSFGLKIQEIATFNLARFFSLIAILTMFTSYFVQSICIRDLFRFDFKLGRTFGWVLALFLPLIIFLFIFYFNLVTFVDILSIAGIVSSGVTVLLIVLMVKKAREIGVRKPEYEMHINPIIISFVLLLFLLGILSAVLHYFS